MGTPQARERVAVMTAEEYLHRAAERFLAAWTRQDGQVQAVACGITYAANMMGKGMNATGTLLPGTTSDWWAARYHALAVSLTDSTPR